MGRELGEQSTVIGQMEECVPVVGRCVWIDVVEADDVTFRKVGVYCA